MGRRGLGLETRGGRGRLREEGSGEREEDKGD